VRPTVLLFDIDGTLVSTGGAGRRAIERAFEQRHGRSDACAGFSFGGMTDRAIVRAGLAALGQSAEPSDIDALLSLYLTILEEEIASSTACRIHAGIERALDEARARPAVALGLGTGNIREGARIKLSRVGLFERFAFGGFGCDHEDRAELIRVGAERGARALGLPVEACRVVVIGDTPKDIAAARAIGAECLAVATGSFSKDALAAEDATYVFGDLTAPGALDALLGG